MAAQEHIKLKANAQAARQLETFVASFAARHRLCKDDRARALIVVEELITNLHKFGYQGRSKAGSAEVALLLEDGRLTIEMIDDGCAFDPFAAAEPDFSRPLEARPVGGMGLRIVRLLAEAKDYSRVNDRNIVRVTLHLTPPPLPS